MKVASKDVDRNDGRYVSKRGYRTVSMCANREC